MAKFRNIENILSSIVREGGLAIACTKLSNTNFYSCKY